MAMDNYSSAAENILNERYLINIPTLAGLSEHTPRLCHQHREVQARSLQFYLLFPLYRLAEAI